MERKHKINWYCALGIKGEWKFPESDDHIPLVINGIERKFIRGSLTNNNIGEFPMFFLPLQKTSRLIWTFQKATERKNWVHMCSI